MKNNLFYTCLLLIWSQFGAQAQQLILQGRITYEKKENMHKLLSEDDDVWSNEMRKRMPKYRTDTYQLAFNRNKSVYKLLQEEENPMIASSFWRVCWNNNVLMDLQSERLVAEKAVYDQNYHVEDSIPQYKWKITGEYREIAGYNCRKATTIVKDSIYLIAFYTEDIPVSAGPESMNGLPGMILGMVAPKLNITWFATKVEYAVIPDKEMITTRFKKAKLVNNEGLFTEINEALKDWGKYGRRIYWRVIL